MRGGSDGGTTPLSSPEGRLNSTTDFQLYISEVYDFPNVTGEEGVDFYNNGDGLLYLLLYFIGDKLNGDKEVLEKLKDLVQKSQRFQVKTPTMMSDLQMATERSEIARSHLGRSLKRQSNVSTLESGYNRKQSLDELSVFLKEKFPEESFKVEALQMLGIFNIRSGKRNLQSYEQQVKKYLQDYVEPEGVNYLSLFL